MVSPELENYPEWQGLLPELLSTIAKRLTSIYDFISFRGVCRLWRSAVTFDNFDREFPRLPWLMYVDKPIRDKKEVDEILDLEEGKPTLNEEEFFKALDAWDGEEVVDILNFEEGNTILDKKDEFVKIWDVDTNTYKITNIPLRCWRRPLSCFGWILCRFCTGIFLRHFLLPISIKLPDMDYISKMVLSGSPMKPDCVVMIIWSYEDQLAFCRPGDESWTKICGENDSYNFFFDIIYHNRKLYAMSFSGERVVECDIHGSNPTEHVQIFAFPYSCMKSCYLVESRGKILIVRLYTEHDHVKFRIFELDLKDGSFEEIQDLENRSLFLGTNSSICVEIPDSSSEVMPGRIYYTYTNMVVSGPLEGVYRFCDGHFEHLSIDGEWRCGHNLFTVSTGPWVVPSI